MRVTPVFCLLLCATSAAAAPPSTVAGTCPQFPADAALTLAWNVLRTDSALLCRAVRKDDGAEAFSLTLTRKPPFRPDNALREQAGEIHGQKIWWYRGQIAGRPEELVRETLVTLEGIGVAHVAIRTRDSDSDNLDRYRQVVQGLRFDAPDVAAR